MELAEVIQFIAVVTYTSLFGMWRCTSFTDDIQMSINITSSVLCHIEVRAFIRCQAVCFGFMSFNCAYTDYKH